MSIQGWPSVEETKEKIAGIQFEQDERTRMAALFDLLTGGEQGPPPVASFGRTVIAILQEMDQRISKLERKTSD